MILENASSSDDKELKKSLTGLTSDIIGELVGTGDVPVPHAGHGGADVGLVLELVVDEAVLEAGQELGGDAGQLELGRGGGHDGEKDEVLHRLKTESCSVSYFLLFLFKNLFKW